MSQGYTHSQTFGELKAIKEDLGDNLTSAQYLHTLDYFLWKAVAQIAKACPSFFKNFVAKCVAAQALNPNSKFTSANKEDLPPLLFRALLEPTSNKQVDTVQKMYLNRGLTFGFVSLFLSLTEEYEELSDIKTPGSRTDRLLRISQIEYELGVRKSLYPVIQDVKYWIDKALLWKNIIIQKYTRLALMTAQKIYVEFQHAVDLDDVVQIHLLIMSKAIDRCNPRMGVLTSFIQSWMKSARAQVAELAKRHQDESLDSLFDVVGDALDLGAVNPDRSYELVRSISWAAHRADPAGLVRTSLGIPPYVSGKDRKLLFHFIKQ